MKFARSLIYNELILVTTMRVLLFAMLLFISAYSDFTLTYKIDNSIVQTVKYHDSKHVLFDIKKNNITLEKLLIRNDKKYIIFNENGVENIYEISDELSDPVKDTNNSSLPNYKILERDTNLKISGFQAQKWLVKYGDDNSTAELTVSNDPKIVNAISLTAKALKKLLPADKQEQANMFNIAKDYVILETSNLKLISFNDQKIALSIYDIDKTLTDEEEKKFSDNIQECFTNVCCGQKSSKANLINNFLQKKVDGWELIKVAKCENSNEEKIESAVYKNSSKSIIVEITTDKMPSGKIESLQSQGLEIKELKKELLMGYEMQTAYLPIVDATVSDIKLPNTIISIYSKGKNSLSDFAKKALKLQLKSAYSTSSI